MTRGEKRRSVAYFSDETPVMGHKFSYFIHTIFTSYLKPARCPYIKTPRRYTRAENQTQVEMATSINTIVKTISHQKTTPKAIRTSINSEVM